MWVFIHLCDLTNAKLQELLDSASLILEELPDADLCLHYSLKTLGSASESAAKPRFTASHTVRLGTAPLQKIQRCSKVLRPSRIHSKSTPNTIFGLWSNRAGLLGPTNSAWQQRPGTRLQAPWTDRACRRVGLQGSDPFTVGRMRGAFSTKSGERAVLPGKQKVGSSGGPFQRKEP